MYSANELVGRVDDGLVKTDEIFAINVEPDVRSDVKGLVKLIR